MKSFESFVAKFTAYQGSWEEPKVRNNVGLFEGWVSVWGNLFLFLLKAIMGYSIGSIALIADAFHTLSDVASSAVVIFGFNVANKPADKEHPFGHGRAEVIATLTIAILMAVVGFEFFKEAIVRLFSPEDTVTTETLNWLFIIIVTSTAIVKAIMAWFAYKLGDLIDSDALRGDAMHHKSDVYTTILVIVALIGAKYGFSKLDGIMGIGVAFMLVHAGYEIARDAIDELLGKPVSQLFIKKIIDYSISVPGVQNVHDVIVHTYGSQKFISLHVEILANTASDVAHNIADNVERKIAYEIGAQVVTHIDPIMQKGKDIKRVQTYVDGFLNQYEEILNFQDLRVLSHDDTIETILLELVVPMGCEKETEIYSALKDGMKNEFPESQILIDVKPKILTIEEID